MRILSAVGTRPEAVKMAMVARTLSDSRWSGTCAVRYSAAPGDVGLGIAAV